MDRIGSMRLKPFRQLKNRLKNCLRTIQAVMLSLTTELATVFHLPRSFGPVELGQSKGCLPDCATPFGRFWSGVRMLLQKILCGFTMLPCQFHGPLLSLRA